MRRCPYEKWLTQRRIPRTACAAMRRKLSGEGKWYKDAVLSRRAVPHSGAARRERLSRKEGWIYDKKSLFGK